MSRSRACDAEDKTAHFGWFSPPSLVPNRLEHAPSTWPVPTAPWGVGEAMSEPRNATRPSKRGKRQVPGALYIKCCAFNPFPAVFVY
eukprot:4269554-Prymnesium_polylepis.1